MSMRSDIAYSSGEGTISSAASPHLSQNKYYVGPQHNMPSIDEESYSNFFLDVQQDVNGRVEDEQREDIEADEKEEDKDNSPYWREDSSTSAAITPKHNIISPSRSSDRSSNNANYLPPISTATDKSSSTATSASSYNSQLWTTLSIHAASAAMSTSYPAHQKTAAAQLVSSLLLQDTKDMNTCVEITHQTIRNAASKASIAILSSGDNNEGIATVVASSILKDGNRILREIDKIKRRSSGGIDETTSSAGYHIMSKRSTEKAAYSTANGNASKSSSQQAKQQQDEDTKSVLSISTSKFGGDKYATTIPNSPNAQSIPSIITQMNRGTSISKEGGGSGGTDEERNEPEQMIVMTNESCSSSLTPSIYTEETTPIKEGSNIPLIMMEKSAPGGASPSSIRTESYYNNNANNAGRAVSNNYDIPATLTTHRGNTSYLGPVVNEHSFPSTTEQQQQQRRLYQLEEEELERKRVNFLAAMSHLQQKLDELDNTTTINQNIPGNSGYTTSGPLTKEELLAIAAAQQQQQQQYRPLEQQQQLEHMNMPMDGSSYPPLPNAHITLPTVTTYHHHRGHRQACLAEESCTPSITSSDHGRYSLPSCATSSVSSIRSVLRPPSKCFPIVVEEFNNEEKEKKLQAQNGLGVINEAAEWDEDFSVYLSVGECRTIISADANNTAPSSVDGNTTENDVERNEEGEEDDYHPDDSNESIEIVLVASDNQQQQQSSSLKNRVKDLFRRTKKISFDANAKAPSMKGVLLPSHMPRRNRSKRSIRRERRRARRASNFMKQIQCRRRVLMKEMRGGFSAAKRKPDDLEETTPPSACNKNIKEVAESGVIDIGDDFSDISKHSLIPHLRFKGSSSSSDSTVSTNDYGGDYTFNVLTAAWDAVYRGQEALGMNNTAIDNAIEDLTNESLPPKPSLSHGDLADCSNGSEANTNEVSCGVEKIMQAKQFGSSQWESPNILVQNDSQASVNPKVYAFL